MESGMPISTSSRSLGERNMDTPWPNSSKCSRHRDSAQSTVEKQKQESETETEIRNRHSSTQILVQTLSLPPLYTTPISHSPLTSACVAMSSGLTVDGTLCMPDV